MPSQPAAVRLRVALRGVRPAVRRTIIAPLDIRLDQLHTVLQAAFGWTDSHLWEFRAGGFAWSAPKAPQPQEAGADVGEAGSDARTTSLKDALRRAGSKPLHYVYDFGDCWIHELAVEERISASGPETALRLVAASGRCPPEDIGGARAYSRLASAVKDPTACDHALACDILGESYDGARIDKDALAERVAHLAAVWGMAPDSAPT